MTGRTLLSVAALVIDALSLGPSYAHVLEAPPRLLVWTPALWREATVFNGQFELFGLVGGPIDIAAIVILFALAWVLRSERRAFRAALAAAAFYALGLAVWFAWVAPANGVLATWRPGPLPADFESIRTRWETGHMVVAGLKLAGFVCLAVAALRCSSGGPRR
ncbi:MAG: DUF1772 domain-containing protein [Alphaproteobacteria bacterium]|nr:DUF1772 domain-containing protein [Alphaproteobacteria bacterium]